MAQHHVILGQLVEEAYQRFKSFALNGAQIDAVVTEAAAFFDKPTVCLRLLAPVLSVRGARDIPPIPARLVQSSGPCSGIGNT
jgi:hypothetical protein